MIADGAQGDREFFKELELTEHAGQLESVLKSLASKGFGLRMYAVAGEQAKLLHADLDEQQRMDRVRRVVRTSRFEHCLESHC